MTAIPVRLLGVLLMALSAIRPGLAQDQAAGMVGRWYGSVNQSPYRYEWLTEHRSDGTVRIQFHNCAEIEDTIETGYWHVQAGLYVTRVKLEGLSDSTYRIESYALEEMLPEQIRYRHFATGVVFEARRVGTDFRLPGCDLSS